MTSILWKTVEKNAHNKKINATQMRSISTQRIQQFQQKDKLFIYGIYLLYYLLNRYYKCCRMLKMVLTGCCRVLKNVERVLNGVGMIKCAK